MMKMSVSNATCSQCRQNDLINEIGELLISVHRLVDDVAVP